jgi:uncharacterized protein YraI
MIHNSPLPQPLRWFTSLLTVSLAALLILVPIGMAQAATPVSGPVIVRPGGASLYSTPEGDVVTTLTTGTVFTAMGRTEDQAWIVGQTVEGRSGWLRVEQVIAVGIDLLSVYSGTTALPAGTEPVPGDAALISPNLPMTATSAVTSTLMGTVASGDDRLNIRNGPGTTYTIVGKALPGESYSLIGRTADATWLQIDRGDGAMGWVSAGYLSLNGNVISLPIISLPIIAEPIIEYSVPPPTATPATATTQPSQTAAPTSAAVTDLSGTLVIQSSPGGMSYGYNLSSGALWPLSNGFDPAISPDGQTVVFVRDGGENGLYLINIDGSNERLIFSGRTRLSSPKWSPDGQWILFTRSDEFNRCYQLGPVCIDAPTGPDGNTVSFGDDVERVQVYQYKLASVDRDGNNYHDIAALDTARAADWNEAGIVYQSAAGLQITTDTSDAENQLVIYNYLKPSYDDPDWQPQGGRIVYMGKEASHWEIFTVNPDGSGRTALTRPVTTLVDELPSNVAPAWSPDGQHILFLSNRMDNHEAGAWRVWVMDADGANQRPLPLDLEISYSFGGEQAVSWAQ